MANIIFTDLFNVSKEFYPKPASLVVPEWYKDMPSYITDDEIKKPFKNGATSASIKRCMPVFDAITSGYILTTYVDLYVSQVPFIYIEKDGSETASESETVPQYTWPSFKPIDFHPIVQAPNHPNRNGLKSEYPKWMNPWSIKTEPGYSTLFVQPFHRESIFTILPGVVDTDQYSAAVNFPFVLNDWGFEGMIPAGTPMAQVIPFKRESWKMSLGSSKEVEEDREVNTNVRSRFFDSYKSFYRQKKEYK
jgi:hypothetical protein